MKKDFKILVIDDYSAVKHGISLILKGVGNVVEIIQTTNFIKVLEKLNENPDLNINRN